MSERAQVGWFLLLVLVVLGLVGNLERADQEDNASLRAKVPAWAVRK